MSDRYYVEACTVREQEKLREIGARWVYVGSAPRRAFLDFMIQEESLHDPSWCPNVKPDQRRALLSHLLEAEGLPL